MSIKIKVKNVNEIKIENFYAKDIYPIWKKHISKAEKSITVFSPYVDRAVNSLLRPIKTNISKTIITRVDGTSFFEKNHHLNTLKRSIESGTTVKHLDELHAKILLIDDKYICLGSQNFTSRGRENKEASFASTQSFKGSDILDTILIWKMARI